MRIYPICNQSALSQYLFGTSPVGFWLMSTVRGPGPVFRAGTMTMGKLLVHILHFVSMRGRLGPIKSLVKCQNGVARLGGTCRRNRRRSRVTYPNG